MTYVRTSEDLRLAAEFQLQAIQLSARAFDDGLRGEAARLANAIFILCGRGMKSHVSIMDAADQQNKKSYRSTKACSDDVGSPLILCRLTKVDTDAWTADIKPAGQDALHNGRDLEFDEWWHEPIISTSQITLSRSKVVRILRDKNGGAHFDPVVTDPLIADTLRGHIGAFYIKNDGSENEMAIQGSLECVMRQIVTEFWFSLAR